MEQLPALPGDVRQEQRIGALPELYRTAHERLAVELAMLPSIDDAGLVFRSHGFTEDQGLALLGDSKFIALLERAAKDARENGVTFRTKARVQAEELLKYSYSLATDDQVSSAVRADLIKWTAKVAGLEPTTKDDKTAGTGLTLSITFSGSAPEKVISAAAPLVIEHEGGA